MDNVVNQNNVVVLEQSAYDLQFSNLNITPTATGNALVISGHYSFQNIIRDVSLTIPFPAVPANDRLNEWNLYLWYTDFSFHLDFDMQRPPSDPFGVAGIAFGFVPGTSCTIPCDMSIYYVMPRTDQNNDNGHGIKSDGSHDLTLPNGGTEQVQAATVQQ